MGDRGLEPVGRAVGAFREQRQIVGQDGGAVDPLLQPDGGVGQCRLQAGHAALGLFGGLGEAHDQRLELGAPAAQSVEPAHEPRGMDQRRDQQDGERPVDEHAVGHRTVPI